MRSFDRYPAGKCSRLRMHSSWGLISIHVFEGRVVSCELSGLTVTPKNGFRWRKTERRILQDGDTDILKAAERYVRNLFMGRQTSVPPLVRPSGTDFSKKVWSRIRAIPPGEVRTYGGLASEAGRPRAARAAGRACGANPLPLFIPCHRVVAANGAQGGYSSGLPWKAYLLKVERTT